MLNLSILLVLGGGKPTPLTEALKRQRLAYVSEAEVSLLYKVNSKTIKATKEPCLRKAINK